MIVSDTNQPLPYNTQGIGQMQDTHGPREPIPHLPGYAADFSAGPSFSRHSIEIGYAAPINFGAYEHRPNRAPDNPPLNVIGTSPNFGSFNGSPQMGNQG